MKCSILAAMNKITQKDHLLGIIIILLLKAGKLVCKVYCSLITQELNQIEVHHFSTSVYVNICVDVFLCYIDLSFIYL